MSKLFCFAHRGGRGHGTENSLATIADSLDMGVDAIEIDVWLVAGRLIVTHDRLLGRVVKGFGNLLNLSADKADQLMHHDGSPVPVLQQVLELVGQRAMLNIEIKGPGTAPGVAATLRDYCQTHGVPMENYLVSSFDHIQLQWLQQNAPEIRRAALISSIPVDLAACGERLGAWALNPSLNFINRELVDDALARGLKVFVYTVNEPEDIRAMAELGVTGVFTDFPERVVEFNRDAD